MKEVDLILDQATLLKYLERDLLSLNRLEIKENNQMLFKSFSYPICKLSFHKLINLIELSPFAYFKSKDNNSEYLGINILHKIESILALNEITNIIKIPEHKNLVFFGGQNFSNHKNIISEEWNDFSNNLYFLPNILIKRNLGQYSIDIFFKKSDLTSKVKIEKRLLDIKRALKFYSSRNIQLQTRKTIDIPQKDQWLQNINNLTSQLKKTSNKVVLARKKIYELTNNKQNLKCFFHQKSTLYPNSYNFYISLNKDKEFISFSPEKFLKIKNNILEIDALAGSATSEQELFSNKNIEEHNFVRQMICNNLKKLNINYNVEFEKEVLNLKYILHLHTMIKGRIENLDILQKLNTLHPTPAVGGFPQQTALPIIRKIESFFRGWYAAPVGIISKDHTELLVAIRSALRSYNQLHLFAGAGITKDSIALEEWEETNKKMQNLYLDHSHSSSNINNRKLHIKMQNQQNYKTESFKHAQ